MTWRRWVLAAVACLAIGSSVAEARNRREEDFRFWLLSLVDGAGGSVAKSPDLARYRDGTTVTLTATPDAGYRTSWSGDTTSTSGNTATVAMTAARSVTATFIAQWDIAVTISPVGTGTVTSSPTGSPAGTHDDGTAVTLTATPVAGRTLTGWTVDTTTAANPLLFAALHADKAVTATFDSAFWAPTGTGTQYALCADAATNDEFDFGTGDFTLEAWVYITDTTASSAIFAKHPAGSYGTGDWQFYIGASGATWGRPYFYLKTAAGYVQNTVNTNIIAKNTWTHVTFVMTSNSGQAFVNGATAGSAANYGTNTRTNASQAIISGIDAPIKGKLAQLRIWKGTARTAALIGNHRRAMYLAGPTTAYGFGESTGDSFTPYLGTAVFTNGSAGGADSNDLTRTGPYTSIAAGGPQP